MKRLVTYILFVSVALMSLAQKQTVLNVYTTDNDIKKYVVNSIDSITHDNSNQQQEIHYGGTVDTIPFSQIESIEFDEENIKVFAVPDSSEDRAAFLLTNGYGVCVDTDSIGGHNIVISKYDWKKNEWDDYGTIAIYCDSEYCPLVYSDGQGNVMLINYDEVNDTYSYLMTDSAGTVVEKKSLSLTYDPLHKSLLSRADATPDYNMTIIGGFISALSIIQGIVQLDVISVLGNLGAIFSGALEDNINIELGQLTWNTISLFMAQGSTSVLSKFLGPVGFIVQYVQFLDFLKDCIVKYHIGNATPVLDSIKRIELTGQHEESVTANFTIKGVGEDRVKVLDDFANGAMLWLPPTMQLPARYIVNALRASSLAEDVALFEISHWREYTSGDIVGDVYIENPGVCENGTYSKLVPNISTRDIHAFQIKVYPSRYSMSELLRDLYCFKSNIIRIDMSKDPIDISHIEQKETVYKEGNVVSTLNVTVGVNPDCDASYFDKLKEYGFVCYLGEGNRKVFPLKKLTEELNFKCTVNKSYFTMDYDSFRAVFDKCWISSYCETEWIYVESDINRWEIVYDEKPEITITSGACKNAVLDKTETRHFSNPGDDDYETNVQIINYYWLTYEITCDVKGSFWMDYLAMGYRPVPFGDFYDWHWLENMDVISDGEYILRFSCNDSNMGWFVPEHNAIYFMRDFVVYGMADKLSSDPIVTSRNYVTFTGREVKNEAHLKDW